MPALHRSVLDLLVLVNTTPLYLSQFILLFSTRPFVSLINPLYKFLFILRLATRSCLSYWPFYSSLSVIPTPIYSFLFILLPDSTLPCELYFSLLVKVYYTLGYSSFILCFFLLVLMYLIVYSIPCSSFIYATFTSIVLVNSTSGCSSFYISASFCSSLLIPRLARLHVLVLVHYFFSLLVIFISTALYSYWLIQLLLSSRSLLSRLLSCRPCLSSYFSILVLVNLNFSFFYICNVTSSIRNIPPTELPTY